MRDLYREFFHIPKDGKIGEKTMLTRVAATVGIIVACLVAMSISAYAYFTHNVTSGLNIIKAADFEITVSVFQADGVTAAEDVTVITSNYKSFKLEGLTENVPYVIKLGLGEANTAKTGFVELSADWYDAYFITQQLGVDINAPSGETKNITFQLTLTVNDVDDDDTAKSVKLFAHWGTSSCYDKYKNSANEQYITQEGYAEKYNDEIVMDNSVRFVQGGLEDEDGKLQGVTYVVQENDNLWEIAKAYGVSVDALMAYNQKSDNIIRPGEELAIPPAHWEVPDDWENPAATPDDSTDESEDSTPPVTATPPVTTTAPSDTNEGSGVEEEGAEDGEEQSADGNADGDGSNTPTTTQS